MTLEDLLEEIVGDVSDEFDVGGETVVEQPDGSYLVDGLMAVEEVDDRFALGIEEPFYDTVGGYVFGQLGRAAAVDDEVQAPSGRWLRVAELDGLRVARVSIIPLHAAEPVAEGMDGGGRARARLARLLRYYVRQQYNAAAVARRPSPFYL